MKNGKSGWRKRAVPFASPFSSQRGLLIQWFWTCFLNEWGWHRRRTSRKICLFKSFISVSIHKTAEQVRSSCCLYEQILISFEFELVTPGTVSLTNVNAWALLTHNTLIDHWWQGGCFSSHCSKLLDPKYIRSLTLFTLHSIKPQAERIHHFTLQ